MPRFRDAVRGRFVTKATADAAPDTTIREKTHVVGVRAHSLLEEAAAVLQEDGHAALSRQVYDLAQAFR